MKKVNGVFVIALSMLTLAATSCKKCSECHYDGVGGAEMELGEYCDEDLENLEASGYHDHAADTTYEVHCHGH